MLALARYPALAGAAFLAAHLALGVFHPAVQRQLHALADDQHRTTMISAGSLTLQIGAITSQLALTNLAGATSIPAAWLVASAFVLVAVAIQSRTARTAPTASTLPPTSGVTRDVP